jgi:hypothetical protein
MIITGNNNFYSTNEDINNRHNFKDIMEYDKDETNDV